MITIRGWLGTDMEGRCMLLGFECAFKCQQRVSLTAYKQNEGNSAFNSSFLDGALLRQHAAVCLLALFFMPLQVECADCRLGREK